LHAGDSHRWLSRLNWFSGFKEESARHGGRAIDILESFPDTKELAMAYANMAQLGSLGGGDSEGFEQWASKALEVADRIDDNEVRLHAAIILGDNALMTGRAEGRAVLERSLDSALELSMDEHAARSYTNLGCGLIELREYHDGESYLRAGIEFCTKRDLDSWRVYLTGWLARARFEQGYWDEAVDHATWVITRPSVSPISRVSALIVLGHVCMRRGLAEAGETLDEALHLASSMGEHQRLAPTVAARAEANLFAGNTSAVLDEALPILEAARAGGFNWAAGELAYLCHRAGHAISDADSLPGPYRLAIRGDHEEAALLWERIGCPYEAAVERGLSGDPETAGRGLSELIFLGSEPAAREIRRSLAASGVRIRRGPSATTRGNVAGLTSREVEVLDLICEGLQNRQIAEQLFVSARTVDHHVAAILRKLRVDNRDAARVEAKRIGLL
jgi:DNA-binding CsgD family transcriptional regulator